MPRFRKPLPRSWRWIGALNVTVGVMHLAAYFLERQHHTFDLLGGLFWLALGVIWVGISFRTPQPPRSRTTL